MKVKALIDVTKEMKIPVIRSGKHLLHTKKVPFTVFMFNPNTHENLYSIPGHADPVFFNPGHSLQRQRQLYC